MMLLSQSLGSTFPTPRQRVKRAQCMRHQPCTSAVPAQQQASTASNTSAVRYSSRAGPSKELHTQQQAAEPLPNAVSFSVMGAGIFTAIPFLLLCLHSSAAHKRTGAAIFACIQNNAPCPGLPQKMLHAETAAAAILSLILCHGVNTSGSVTQSPSQVILPASYTCFSPQMILIPRAIKVRLLMRSYWTFAPLAVAYMGLLAYSYTPDMLSLLLPGSLEAGLSGAAPLIAVQG
eukprot:scaffold206075_cov18-Tisochrysis_lutea.AAC.3